MADTQTERETTYAVDADFVLGDLTALLPVGGSLEEATVLLESEYFDTADHDLLAHGVTLRSRSGDTDAGWQLKLPAGNDRIELTPAPTGSDATIPEELLTLTSGLRRGTDLRHIATIRTHRGIRRLLDDTGGVLVEIADDTVHSSAPSPDGALLQEWREIEADFGAAATGKAATALGHRLAKRLRKSGATIDTSPNQVAHALNGGAHPSAPEKGKRSTAGAVVLEYLRQQDDALIAGDLSLRQGKGGIHPTRVGTRRLRSTLRIFGPLFDAGRATQFDAELAWYATVLGEVRDREVQRERMRRLVAELPAELVLGPVAATIEKALLAEQIQAQHDLDTAMTSDRYYALLQESRRWATEPPFTAAADAAPDTLRPLLHRSAKKLAKHLAAGLTAGNDEELHKARKAGKRARYAAELTTPVLGHKKSHRLVSRYQKLQDTLGDHQDGVVSCGLLKRLALGTVGKRTQNGFTFGLLYAREQQRAEESRRSAERLHAKLSGRS